MSRFDLSPLQEQGTEWLRETGRRYLADPPGFGKTRQLLAAVGEVPTVVVAPAAIRDAEVWQTEAKTIGWDAPMKVISYHQLAQGSKALDPTQYQALIFDEAHWLKNRKVSWGTPGDKAARLIPTVLMGSGTPTPNDASELWGQLRMIRDLPAFWKWADGNTKENATGWFHISTKTDRGGNVLSQYVIAGHLQACVEAGCYNARRDQKTGELEPITDEDCEHWKRFRTEVQDGWMLGRPEESLDLPPMSGYDTPLWTPMKPTQAKLYRDLKKDLIAMLPEHGIELEAVSNTQQFVQCWMLSTGVGSIDPSQDPDGKHSGKGALIRELLDDRDSPTLLGTYFKNTAVAMTRMCKDIGKSFVLFGAASSPKQRKEAVQAFQSGAVDVMIGSIPVVGEGLTLTAADSVFLAERMWTPDKNFQVVRRARRRGQTREVSVRQPVTPKTIDQGQWEMLKIKKARIDKVDVVRLLEGEYVPA